MVDYNIVKFCRACKKRYVINKTESKKNYCDECEAKFRKEQAEKDESESKEQVEKD